MTTVGCGTLSFSTRDYNETLTMAMNGLAKDRDLCDPMRVPPWALTSATWANITANMEIGEEFNSVIMHGDWAKPNVSF